MKRDFKVLYTFLAVCILAFSTIGATYAYWAATASSANNALQTESTIYSISMNITPLYHDFSVIPMDDTDALKGLKGQCKDKYDRGACSAYEIYVYGYNKDLDYVSGFMDITTENMQNLSYMVLRLSDTYEEDSCVIIKNKENVDETYCIVKEATPMGDGIGLSLGDSYDVKGMDSTKFILMMWLSNLKQSQNDIDVGSFNAIVTIQAGNGGEIKGSIANAVKIEDGTGDSTDEGNIDSGSENTGDITDSSNGEVLDGTGNVQDGV